MRFQRSKSVAVEYDLEEGFELVVEEPKAVAKLE